MHSKTSLENFEELQSDIDSSFEENLLKKQGLIFFGSKCPRDTFSRRGMNSFMRYYSPEEYPEISPCSYEVLKSFKSINTKPCSGTVSKKGFSGLARFAVSTKSNEKCPAPCDYSPPVPFSPRKIESKAPFSCTAKRKTYSVNKNPGPGLYHPYEKKRNITFDHSFGGRVRMHYSVQLKCNKKLDICKICDENPLGDYWHRENQVFLCRPCMLEQRRIHSKFTRKELSQFSKMRHCSGIHLHEGTNAKIWLVSPKQILKSIRKEAYLSCFFES